MFLLWCVLYIVVPHAANEFADNLFYLWSKFFANLSRKKGVHCWHVSWRTQPIIMFQHLHCFNILISWIYPGNTQIYPMKSYLTFQKLMSLSRDCTLNVNGSILISLLSNWNYSHLHYHRKHKVTTLLHHPRRIVAPSWKDR
jgi:hypothetical protein